MNINNVFLDKVGTKIDQYPVDGRPEIAFAGKSNVGKSSLINGLIQRKKLARTSGQPGKTQTINFYNIDDTIYFVDLPGYGYAKVSKRDRDKWGMMIEEYLSKRGALMQIFILVDIRHKPSENDKMMVDWVRAGGLEPMIIATKADKIKRNQIPKHCSVIRKELEIKDINRIIPFSAETKLNKEKIWEIVGGLVEQEVKGIHPR